MTTALSLEKILIVQILCEKAPVCTINQWITPVANLGIKHRKANTLCMVHSGSATLKVQSSSFYAFDVLQLFVFKSWLHIWASDVCHMCISWFESHSAFSYWQERTYLL